MRRTTALAAGGRSAAAAKNPSREACRWLLAGHVQGVGFRPFVYRLAGRYRLAGWVQNQMGQVEILAEGEAATLEAFGAALVNEAPPLARPTLVCREQRTPDGLAAFRILDSAVGAQARIFVPADQFMCEDCRRELADPAERRFRYPFNNCTQCGPRYTLIRRLPYDRANTSMEAFVLCPPCRAEYEDPLDRRFHAEPVACPDCGPWVRFQAADLSVCEREAALTETVRALHRGEIVAVKGVGGYHLMCDARNGDAVRRLRLRKPRPDKPLAVMFPFTGKDGLAELGRELVVDTLTAERLLSPMRPIVLVSRRSGGALAANIAPGLAEIGAMLPYSPLHHLLLGDVGGPLVATSGNLSGEPVLTDEDEAARRLAHVADAFLHHNRPIVRPADDSVFRVIAGRPRPIRLGRGASPLELALPVELPRPVLAVGGHLKCTVALAWEDRVVISPHIGDMGTPRSLKVLAQVVEDLQALYGVQAEALICDLHPSYATTRWALAQDLPLRQVQHHRAHASAITAEHDPAADWIAFAWDGLGYGDDGTLWGGEAFAGGPGRWRRVATLRPFSPPGGDRAGREPWRSAAALCWESGLDWHHAAAGPLVRQAWERRLNCPQTSAVGRLFDGAAALLGLAPVASFEGQAPMLLEACAAGGVDPQVLPLERRGDGLWQWDWAPLLPALLDAGRERAERAGLVHATLARILLEQARKIRDESGVNKVALGGGVFQNRLLTEQALALLQGDGFEAALAERLPPNDGGLSYGQIIEHAAEAQGKRQ